jgi:putative ABC transport system permease protein
MIVTAEPDFAVTQPDGTQQTVEDFEGLSHWAAAPTNTQNQDVASMASDLKHGGAEALKFDFQKGSATGVRGIVVNDPNVPLPAIVSNDFAARTGAGAGTTTFLLIDGVLVPIHVVAVANLFPTLDPGNGPFVILNRAHLFEWLDRLADSNSNQLNEVWLKVAPGTDRTALSDLLSQPPYRLGPIVDLATELKLTGADPLVASGRSGILLVSFLALLVLIAGAFLVSLYASLQRRRIEFAVMSALGLGRTRVFLLLAFEFTVVTAIGAVAGLGLGLGISRLMLSFLEVTETGSKVVPPFVLVTNWAIIGVALGCLGAIVAACIAIGVRIFTAGSASAVLRVTE